MITTIVTVLGVGSFFYGIGGLPKWVKVVFTMMLAIPYILGKIMDWAVEKSFVRVQFVLKWSLSSLCRLLKIHTSVFPMLLSTRSKWACRSQAFGWVSRIPEGSGGQICTLVPADRAAFRSLDKLPVETQLWSDFLAKKKMEFVIGRFLVVTLELPDLGDINNQKTELTVDGTYSSWLGQEHFEAWERYDVAVARIRTLVAALEHWRLNPEMGISVLDSRIELAFGWGLLHCFQILELAERIVDQGEQAVVLRSNYDLPHFAPKFVW